MCFFFSTEWNCLISNKSKSCFLKWPKEVNKLSKVRLCQIKMKGLITTLELSENHQWKILLLDLFVIRPKRGWKYYEMEAKIRWSGGGNMAQLVRFDMDLLLNCFDTNAKFPNLKPHMRICYEFTWIYIHWTERDIFWKSDQKKMIENSNLFSLFKYFFILIICVFISIYFFELDRSPEIRDLNETKNNNLFSKMPKLQSYQKFV